MARRRTKSMNDIQDQYTRIMRRRFETSKPDAANGSFTTAVRYIRNMANALGKPLSKLTSEDLNRQFSRRTYMGLSNG